MIDIEYIENIAILQLNHNVNNPLDRELINRFSESLNVLGSDPNIGGVVITSSSDKYFSIGFNIPELIKLNRQDFKEFYQSFNKLCLDMLSFPKPFVAGIKGHAVAGGCIITLFCDYRIVADGQNLMGLNEIKLGLPVPYPGDCMLRNLVGNRHARKILESGDFYLPNQLLEMELVDEIVSKDKVIQRSVEKITCLANLPAKAYNIVKMNRIEEIERQILKNLTKKEQSFLDCWFTEDTKKRLKKVVKKF